MLMKLPWEIIDKILLYTDDLDLAVKLNRKYCVKNMRKIITNKFKKLHMLYSGRQEYSLQNNPELYNFKNYYSNKDENFKEIKENNGDYHPRFGDIPADTIVYSKAIEIKLVYKSCQSINNLELKFFNPDKKSPEYFIKHIRFTLGGNIMYEIHDIYNYSNIFDQLFKRYIKHENDYTYLPLHFINGNGLLYTPRYHEIVINIKTKIPLTDCSLQGKRYFTDIIEDTQQQMVIYQNIKETQLKQTINEKECILNIKWYNTTNMIYITSENNNYKNIKTIELILDNESIFNISLTSLNQINKNLGYNFCCPVIIFSNTFHEYSNTTINFSRIDTAYLRLTLHQESTKDYDIHYINNNLLIGHNGMYGLQYSA